jgi:phosphomannomutase
MALVLDLLAATGGPLSHLVAGLPRYAMIKDQYPLRPGAGQASGPEAVAALWDRIASAFPEARADRRDGLRLDWDDRWVHVRASNTEPIVRVIAEAAETDQARELARRVAQGIDASRGGAG